jgi:hypothetical protein
MHRDVIIHCNEEERNPVSGENQVLFYEEIEEKPPQG